MHMAVSADNTMAYTVSADHLVCRYALDSGASDRFRIKQAGNACIAVRHDGRVCAVGGWDGRYALLPPTC